MFPSPAEIHSEVLNSSPGLNLAENYNGTLTILVPTMGFFEFFQNSATIGVIPHQNWIDHGIEGMFLQLFDKCCKVTECINCKVDKEIQTGSTGNDS